VPSSLAIYLRNHEAAAQAGNDLFRRTVSNHRRKPYAEELRQLAAEAREDLVALRQLMRRAKVQPDLLLGVALRVGERAGRLKPNGHLIRRAPLSDLVEIEGLLDAVHAKAAGWRALAAARVDDHGQLFEVAALAERAEDQLARLSSIHQTVASAVLDPA
jgi:hypothetical protein